MGCVIHRPEITIKKLPSHPVSSNASTHSLLSHSSPISVCSISLHIPPLLRSNSHRRRGLAAAAAGRTGPGPAQEAAPAQGALGGCGGGAGLVVEGEGAGGDGVDVALTR
jgi:hypothetical protein